MKTELLPRNFNATELKTLSAQNKVQYLLEIFDLAKDGKAEQRKDKFIKLLSGYKAAASEARVRSQIDMGSSRKRKSELRNLKSSDEGQASLHNEIMDIIRKLSLSVGLSVKQRQVAEYLAASRDEVARMVDGYFSVHDTSPSGQLSEIQQARQGIGPFTSKPGEEDY